MARYEATDSQGRKFWSVEVDGATVRTRWGRVGAEGVERTRTFATPAEAARAAADAAAKKKKSGYHEAKEVGVTEGAPSPPEIAAIERAIADDPDDLASRSVYADWLQERGDPLGEILALHVAIAHESDASRRAALKRELVPLRASPSLFGELAAHKKRLDLGWRGGVVERVRVRSGPAERGVSIDALLAAFFALPVARFVTRLALPAYALVDFAVKAAALPEGATLRALRALDVEPSSGPGSGSRAKLARLNPFDRLRSLSIPFWAFDFTGARLPELETVALMGFALRDEDVATLAVAELPRLRRVVVAYSAANVGLGALARLPTLAILRLAGSAFGGADAVEEAVARLHECAPRASAFELDGVDARTLARVEARFPALRFAARRADDFD